jgi:hypothetical protein
MNWRRGLAEASFFLVAAAAGVYGFGQTFEGHIPWLAVSLISFLLLARQMARVQDRWPRRRPAKPPAPDHEESGP